VLWNTSHQGGDTSNVRCVGRLANVPQDHIINQIDVYPGAFDDFLEHDFCQVLGAQIAQRAAVSAARCSDATDQNNIFHGCTPF